MTIALVIGVLGVAWLVVQCWKCPAQDADELQSRIDRLHEEQKVLLHEACQLRIAVDRRGDWNVSLSRALGECLKGLREIGHGEGCGSNHKFIANDALDRIQIPDDQLPTQGYPEEATDG